MSRSTRARRARRAALGIAVIHQELSLVPTLGAADNLFLGRWPTGPLGLVRGREQRAAALRALERFGLDVDPDRPVGELSRPTPADRDRQGARSRRARDRDGRADQRARRPRRGGAPSARVVDLRRARLRDRLHHAPHGGDRAGRRPHHGAARRAAGRLGAARARCRLRSCCAGWAGATRPSPSSGPAPPPAQFAGAPDRLRLEDITVVARGRKVVDSVSLSTCGRARSSASRVSRDRARASSCSACSARSATPRRCDAVTRRRSRCVHRRSARRHRARHGAPHQRSPGERPRAADLGRQPT